MLIFFGSYINTNTNHNSKNGILHAEILLEYHKLYAELESQDVFASPVISARFLFSLTRTARNVVNELSQFSKQSREDNINISEVMHTSVDAQLHSAINAAMATQLFRLFEHRVKGSHQMIEVKYNELKERILESNDEIKQNFHFADSLGKAIANRDFIIFIPSSYVTYPNCAFRDSVFTAGSCIGKETGYQENWSLSLLKYKSELGELFQKSELKTDPLSFKSKLESDLNQEALEVYTLSKPLTKEFKWIAEFWSDDHPGVTFTPATRWISILNQIISKEQPEFEIALDCYYLMSLAMHETAVQCWENKYQIMLDRPSVYIRQNIDSTWIPFHPNPAFPGFPSGHSAFGAAASTIMEHYFGSDYKMTDFSHKGKKAFLSEPRTFNSINEMAIENANSRLYLGVHYRKDCEAGFKMGKEIGEAVIKWFLEDTST